MIQVEYGYILKLPMKPLLRVSYIASRSLPYFLGGIVAFLLQVNQELGFWYSHPMISPKICL